MSNRKRRYDGKLWSTYITEAIQSGNATQYCTDKNIPYRAYQQKLAEYNKIEDKENWSPSSKRRYNHRVFADSTEKEAVEQLTEPYINKQKACNNNDLSDCLLKTHNNKNDVNKCLSVSNSIITRIKQQYKLHTVRAQHKSYNKYTIII